MALSNRRFAQLASYIAKNAAAWASDTLDHPPETEAKLETVRAFVQQMRERLDRIGELGGGDG